MSIDRTDMLADAALRIAILEGSGAFTVSHLARTLHITPQALFNRYGGADRIVRIVVHTLIDRWLEWLRHRQREAEFSSAGAEVPLRAFLPVSAEEVDDVRGWLAVRDLALHGPGRGLDLLPALLRVDDEERVLVRRALETNAAGADDPGVDESRVDGALVDLAHACLVGLRERIVEESPDAGGAAWPGADLAVVRLVDLLSPAERGAQR